MAVIASSKLIEREIKRFLSTLKSAVLRSQMLSFPTIIKSSSGMRLFYFLMFHCISRCTLRAYLQNGHHTPTHVQLPPPLKIEGYSTHNTIFIQIQNKSATHCNMGASAAKPNPPASNEAKADADLAFQGLQLAAQNFLSSIRLGQASTLTLGYSLTDQKLISQEIKLVVQTTANAPKEELAKAVDSIFSGDWKAVTHLIVDSIASFFGGGAPKPTESALNDEFSKSFLVWENLNVVQYSIYIKRTNAKSVGTLLANSEATMISCICKGNVSYEAIDPQSVVGIISQTGIPAEDIPKLLSTVKTALMAAAEIADFKRKLAAGSITPTVLRSSALLMADDEPVPPTPERALVDVIEKGKRVKVLNELSKNLMFNGTLLENTKASQEVSFSPDNYNAISISGQWYVVKPKATIGDGHLVMKFKDGSRDTVVLQNKDNATAFELTLVA